MPKALRAWFAIFLLVAIAGVAAIILAAFSRPALAPSGQTEPQPAGLNVTHYDVSSLPNGFPSDIPRAGEGKVIDNYTAQAGGGSTPAPDFQSTRTFESAQTVADAYAAYLSYLSDAKNGWTVLSQVNDPGNPDQKAIFAQNGEGIVNINISKNAKTGATIVDISFIKNNG